MTEPTTASPLTRLDRRTAAAVTISLLVVLFLAVNLIANVSLRQARVDLTENGLFTLSQGTLNTIRGLEEPVTLQFFFSEKVASDYPTIRSYATRVRDLLEEYEARSGGKVRLEVVDPEPFTEEEDLANALGLTGAQTQDGEMLFFGLVGTNTIDGRELIPFFPQERAAFLEFDLTEMVHKLSTLEKPVLGILSGLPLETGPGGIQAALQGRSRPVLIYEQLQESFEIENLDDAVDRIPSTVQVLLVVHPKPLSDTTLYAIDQFVLGGGRALVFVDPHSGLAAQSAGGGLGQQPDPSAMEPSDLGPLLASWGVTYDSGKVVADLQTAQVVSTQFQGRPTRASYPIWIGLDKSHVAPDDLVTADIETLNLATSGHLEISEEKTTEIVPLVRSSEEAMLLDRFQVMGQPQPEDLLRNFAPTGTAYTLAARITGPAKTAFPGGAPARPAPVEGEEETDGEVEETETPAAHREDSDGPINVIVVADSDLFDDRFWVVEQNLLGQRIAVPTADNANFVVNAVENLTGSNDLISLRSRASGERPFTLVESLRRRAESRFLAQEQALVQRLEQTEAQIAELEGQRDPSDPEAGALLSPEQRQLVERFRTQMIDTRRELRDVQRSLRSEIETLGGWLAFVNIALVPLLLAGIAMAMAWLRHKRRAERLRTGG